MSCNYCLEDIIEGAKICKYCGHYQSKVRSFLINDVAVYVPLLGAALSVLAFALTLIETKNAFESAEKADDALALIKGFVPTDDSWVELKLGEKFVFPKGYTKASYALNSIGKVFIRGQIQSISDVAERDGVLVKLPEIITPVRTINFITGCVVNKGFNIPPVSEQCYVSVRNEGVITFVNEKRDILSIDLSTINYFPNP